MSGKKFYGWKVLGVKLVKEGRVSKVGENGWPKLPLEIRNDEIVGLTEE